MKYKVPQSSGLRKTRLFDRVVGQAVALVVPDGYREMQAKLNAPAPAIQLTITLDAAGLVRKLRLPGDEAEREPRQEMTLDHPVLQRKLAGLEVYDTYRNHAGLTVYRYIAASGENRQMPPLTPQRGDRGGIVETGEGTALVVERLSPAAQIAQILATEYPEHEKRIGLALALVEAGQLKSEYKTTYDPATYYGRYECNCPDSRHRRPRAKFGAACKHCFALEIARLVEAERKAVAYRKLADDIERSRARQAAAQRGLKVALSPGGGGPLHRPKYQQQPRKGY
jgi:hypothetical protein